MDEETTDSLPRQWMVLLSGADPFHHPNQGWKLARPRDATRPIRRHERSSNATSRAHRSKIIARLNPDFNARLSLDQA